MMSKNVADRLRVYLLLFVSAATLVGVYLIAAQRDLKVLPLGGVVYPTQGYGYFLALWTFFGGVSALTLALALARMANMPLGQRFKESLASITTKDASWIAVLSTLAFLVPAAVRVLVLQFAPLTDDEAIYRFTAETLASGRLAAPRPPGHLFWDRAFMAIDDQWIGQYFLGWPALLSLFKRVGFDEFASCVFAALTIPPVYWSVRRLDSIVAARVAATLFVFSPMLMIGSATLMSHAACLCACAWALWFFLLAREPDSKVWTHGAFALLVSIAFFNRPFTTLSLCAGLVIWWLAVLPTSQSRLQKAGLFAAVSSVMAILFFGANYAITGNPLYVPYQRVMHYTIENHYRFGYFGPNAKVDVAGLNFNLAEAIPAWMAALWRFTYAVGGWPVGFVFLPFAQSRSTRVLWMMLSTHILLHVVIVDGGVDSFGPTHYYELSLPFLMLTGIGVAQLRRWLHAQRNEFASLPWAPSLPLALLTALIVTSLLGFTTIRLKTVGHIAESVRAPTEILEGEDIHNAVMFRRGRHNTRCRSFPAKHYVFWPPHNDPDLSNDLLWANHLTLEWDKALMREHFPDRKGYIYYWKSPCELALMDLDEIPPNGVDDAPELNAKPTKGPDD